jgi:hypothetical protein
MTEANDVSAQNKIKLVLAWIFVSVPLIWGVSETLSNAMKLFE